MPKIRIDALLVERGLCSSRNQAQRLITEQKVLCDGAVVHKASKTVLDSADISLTGDDHYVSRGAYKIKAAIDHWKIDVRDFVCVDFGASTGGFTDFLLKSGARTVYALDVGHDQLDHSLRTHDRVINMEGINIRHPITLPETADFAAADLSYISLRLVMDTMMNSLKQGGLLVTLFKPQFETGGPGIVNKQGVVADELVRKNLLKNFLDWCDEKAYTCLGQIPSPIIGKHGNQEFLLLFRK